MDFRDLARSFRKGQTECENRLWQCLRNRNLEGKKFYRQHVLNYHDNGKKKFFVADFYCAERNLVVEVDGKIHDYRQEYDDARTKILTEKGLKVLRIKNEELNQVQEVLLKIKKELTTQP